MHCISLNLRRMIKSGSLSIAACGLLIAVFPAWCGPPFVTDDPETLEYRHHELFIAVEQTNTPGGKTVTPMVDYSYGVLPDLQLGITVPYVFDSPSGQVRQHGLGDLVLGAKYRFVQETDARPMMTFAPLSPQPTGMPTRDWAIADRRSFCRSGSRKNGESGKVMAGAVTGSTTRKALATIGITAR